MKRSASRVALNAFPLFLALCAPSFALNPSLDISQYAHTSWTIREGFIKGWIQSMAQTQDGYMWLGTEVGLFRFDGVRPSPWTPPGTDRLPGTSIVKLLVTRDGTLWIGASAGLASWNGSKLTHYPELDGQRVGSLLQDRYGTIWAGGSHPERGRLCALGGGKAECFGQDGSLGRVVLSLYEDRKGNLWVGAVSGLWLWKPGPPQRFPMPEAVYDLVENDEGQLLILMPGGVQRLESGRAVPYSVRGASNPRYVHRDRDGGLWIATSSQGLLHLHQGRTDAFSRVDGLSAEAVFNPFEDREGNIWAPTYAGLDRFREFPIATLSGKQGLSGDAVSSVLAARDGSIWLSGRNGLDRWEGGQVTTFRKAHGLADDGPHALFQDDRGRIWAASSHGTAYFEGGRFVRVRDVPAGDVTSMTADADNVWISTERGLLHLFGGHLVEQFSWSSLGGHGRVLAMTPDGDHGGLWLGFVGGGVSYFKEGRVNRSYGAAEKLSGGYVTDLRLQTDGTIFASTEKGLSVIKHERITTLTSGNGLPCDQVYWSMEARDGSMWLYMPCGLARIARADFASWMGGAKTTVPVRVFDESDGVTAHMSPGGLGPRAAMSRDGRIWFATSNGVSVIDTAHLSFNNVPPPVHIEQVTADRQVVTDRRLPAMTRDVEIDYTALSLVAPEKVRFKYRLEGHDRDWVDAGNRRQAFFTNLPPRKYRFRVIAANNSGVWNEAGDTLEFSIAPAYYQTTWFRVLCGAAFLVLLAAGYRLRMLQVQRESRQLRDVIETIPAFVWSAAPDGSLDFTNRRFLQFSGFTLPQALGWGWTDAVHPEDRGGLVERWRAAVASGTPLEAEARMRSTTGEYRWLMFRAVPMQDAAGKIVKWYGKTTDIEEQKRAEQERVRLHELEAELAHINRVSMMGELAASVAHEVNQPLTGIVSNGSACLRMLARESSPIVEEVREAIGDIVRDGKRAGEVISRIRAMTKRAALPREHVDVNQVIREVLVLVGDEAKKRGVVVRTHLADDVSPVFADRVQLQQVVLNLVMNAMDAMSSVTGRQRELVIHTRNMEDGHVEVTVEDSGTGLDPTSMSKIFNPFYTTKASGMGMGLSICRSIVQNHGGRLWATANAGAGTSFHFTVPTGQKEASNAGAGGV